MTEQKETNEEVLKDLTIDFETFKKVYQMAKKKKLKTIRFEFIVGSCFPKVMENVKQELIRQHAQGYAEGLKEGLKEGKAGVE